MTIYAKDTKVSVSQTEAEIRSHLLRYGATSFASGWFAGKAHVAFEVNDMRVRFELAMPKPEDPMFDAGKTSAKAAHTPAARQKRCEQEHRARWRALSLVIKAKLEAVESGITTFEDEFLAHIVTAHGPTVGELMAGKLADLTASNLPPLLGSGK